jgi:hypothetical protein
MRVAPHPEVAVARGLWLAGLQQWRVRSRRGGVLKLSQSDFRSRGQRRFFMGGSFLVLEALFVDDS